MFAFKIIVFTFIATAIQWFVVAQLTRLHIYQPIHELSPEGHQQTKTKTPSFGGVGIMVNLIIATVFFGWYNPAWLWLLGITVLFSCIGMTDDLAKAFKSKNKGLSALQKLILQLLISVVAMALFHYFIRPLATWEWPLYLFLFTGVSNATNLTDGLDGLLGGLSILTLIGFIWHFMLLGDTTWVNMLITVVSCVGTFLIFNFHPAKIFMGDTGSLALGAMFTALSLYIQNPWILILLGGVYAIETLSVMIQVTYFKRTGGKRIFKMAPLHHHFELSGYSEIKTAALFWSWGAALLASYIILTFLI